MKITMIIVVVLLALIQFIPIDRDNPVADPNEEIKLQGEVKLIIQTACYDCHSNNTQWPWYSHVAPVSWFVAHDVHEGREKINFSLWNTYSAKRINRKFQEIIDEIDEKEMPLPAYLILHSEADLDDAQRAVLIQWAKSNLEPSPADSLSDQD